MGNHKLILLLFLVFIQRSLAACNEGLGMDADNRKIPDSSITASSEALYMLAKYARLNGQFSMDKRNFGGWCASKSSSDELYYLQVDLGRATTVTGVETQSVHYINRWVQSYTLSYSYDSITWYDYKVDGKGKTFQGNENRYDSIRNKIDPPLTARYIRIMPRTFSGDRPCLRAEIYGCTPAKDCQSAIGVDANVRNIPDKSMTASSEYARHFAYEGRLHNVHRLSSTGERSWGAWCPKKTDTSPYLQIDLGRVRVVSGVATQGYSFNLWTTQYYLNYSIDGKVWKQFTENGIVKLFNGNSDNKTIRTQSMDPKIETVARFVRFIPFRWNNYPKDMACLRVEVYQCAPIKGSVPLISRGIENIVVKRGKSFNLTCIFAGQVGIEVTWKMNGNPLSTTEIISISNSVRDSAYVTSLLFRRISMAENGNTFSCTANYPGVAVQTVSTAQITVDGSIPVLRIIKVGVYSVFIALGVKGTAVSDITAYHITLVDFATSKKISTQFDFNSTNEIKTIRNLRSFTKYSMDARFEYSDGTEGAKIPSQHFRTRECRPENAPVGVLVKRMTSKMLEIQWSPPEHDPCTVAVTSYDVSVVILDTVKRKHKYIFNTTKSNGFNVTDLRPKCEYNVTVRARTVAGAGPFTLPYIITFTPAEAKTVTVSPTTIASTTTTTKRMTTKLSTKTTSFPLTTKSPSLKISEQLQSIKEEGVTSSNIVNVTVRIELLTNHSRLLDSNDIATTADILEDVVRINGSSSEIGDALVKTISNVLNANSSVLEKSYQQNNTGIRYVKILENWLEKVDVEDSERKETSENIIVQKIKIVQGRIKRDIVFEEKGGTSVTVPAEALFGTNSSMSKNESIFFVYYKRNNFFTRRTKISVTCENGFTTEEKRVYTPVLASSIVGREVKNLSKPVVLKFKKNTGKREIEKTACVYWDFSAKDGKGDWSTQGCRLQEVRNDTIICQCDHMTNFAAMLDIYAHTSKACGMHGRALSFISVVGCFLSLIGLFLTLVTYIIFRRLRREIAARIMLQLCFALFLVVVLFLTGMERTKEPTTCLAIGISLHYFTLVAFMWMFMEAVFMYHAFVVVWPPREENDVLKCTIAAWGIPGIIVAATAASDLGHYQGKHYCRVHGLPFYLGFLAPICLSLVINFVIFGIIMYKLSTRPSRSADKRDKSEAMQRLKRAFGIMILMGLTWIFGAMAVEDFRLVLQYLFAICNSLQGFAIFVFYCLSQKNVRDAWVAFLKCDRRSDLKLRTESYYDRRRFSSSASQKSSMMIPRTRTNSSTVMMRNDSSKNRMLEAQKAFDEQMKMQTILEIDVEDRFVDNLTSNIFVDNLEPSQQRADPHISVSSTDDDASKVGSQVALQPYRSYRALSEIKELNALLTLANKRKSSSKSNEMLIRKSLVLSGSSPLLSPKDRMRAVRSCEDVAKVRDSTELDDLAVMRGNQPKVLIQSVATRKREGSREDPPLINLTSSASDCSKSHQSLKKEKEADSMPSLDDIQHGSTYKLPFDSPSNTVDSNNHTLMRDGPTCGSTLQSNGTLQSHQLKSDCGTLRDDNACPFTGPSRHYDAREDTPEFSLGIHDTDSKTGSRRSHEDVIKWLHDAGGEDDAHSISSAEYRSSMCSSFNDLHNGDLPSCRSSFSKAVEGCNSNRSTKNSLLGNMVVGPLRGSSNNEESKCDVTDTESSDHLQGMIESRVSDREMVSDEGYSASEEETNLLDRQLPTKNRKRTKSRNGTVEGSTGFRSAYV